MRSFKTGPFNVAMRLMVPETSKIKGTTTKKFPEPKDCPIIFGSLRTFGGSESTENGIYTVYDTGTIDTWYRPDIKSDCRIQICDTGDVYEIVSSPEDIGMRHQYMQVKVKKIGGKA